MLTRRGFVALSATGITGIGIIGSRQGASSEPRILLELVNASESDATLTASVKPTNDGTSQQRESQLAAGERTHSHLPIQTDMTYEITGEAQITSNDVTAEGFRSTPSIANASFKKAPTTKRATLQRGARVTIHLTDAHIIEIALPQDRN